MKLWTAVKRRWIHEQIAGPFPQLTQSLPTGPGVLTRYVSQLPPAGPPVDAAPFDCEICNKTISNRNNVVCAYVGGDSTHPPTLGFGVPRVQWNKYVCSSQCAHALLDKHIVTWRLQGLFNVPEEVDDY